MKEMTNLYAICSVLMATLFVVSASLQFNDHDWYFWIPLYAGAAYVNLINLVGSVSSKRAIDVGNITLYLGQFLLSKVVLEHFSGASVGMLSVDMRERVVREKFGGVLVCICMIFQISAAASFERDPTKKVNMEVARPTKYGMAVLVGIGYGLSVIFVMRHGQE